SWPISEAWMPRPPHSDFPALRRCGPQFGRFARHSGAESAAESCWRRAAPPLPRLPRSDRRFAFEEELGAFDDRHVDHLAVDGDRADPFGERRVIGGDDPGGVGDFGGGGAELLVQNPNLARMND